MRVAPVWLLLVGGCFGSFRATEAVYNFNRDISDELVLQEIVFLAMVIVPVYEVAAVVDALVLNTIEAFTGENPLGSRVEPLPDGRTVVVIPEAHGVTVAVDGQRARRLLRRGSRLELVEDGVAVGSVERADDGAMIVTDAAGNVQRVAPERVAELLGAARQGTDVLVAEVRGLVEEP